MKETVSQWLLVFQCSTRLQLTLGLGTSLAGCVWLLSWLMITKHAGSANPMMAAVIGAFGPYHWILPLLMMLQTIGLVGKHYEKEKRRVLRW